TVARIVLPCARVERNDVENTPLAFVVPLEATNTHDVPTEHDGVTVAPLIGLLNASRIVIVMSDAVLPLKQVPEQASIEDVAAFKSEFETLTAAALTVTAAVCVMPTPLPVALIVLACANVELRIAVKTPD